MTSPFLNRDRVAENDLAFAIEDIYPVTLGHALVITKRVCATWWAATQAERDAIMALVDVVKTQLDAKYRPAGYNIGFNAGTAAGQTVLHLHVHVIPRYAGDMDHPEGGVRHVIPSRGNYRRVAASWSNPPGPSGNNARALPLTTGGHGAKLDDHLGSLFVRADRAIVVSAFVQNSGLDILQPVFRQMLEQGKQLQLVTGDYLHITQAEALQRLLDLAEMTAACSEGDEHEPALPGDFKVRVIETARLRRAFHPKAWVFEWGADPLDGVAFVGSSNISRSALQHGVEWNLRLERRLDPRAWDDVRAAADRLWSSARPLDNAWLQSYRERARKNARPLPLGEVEDAATGPVEPRDVQVEALAELKDARARGEKRALVVLATGLGKTFLAAFDLLQFSEDRRSFVDKKPGARILGSEKNELRKRAGRGNNADADEKEIIPVGARVEKPAAFTRGAETGGAEEKPSQLFPGPC